MDTQRTISFILSAAMALPLFISGTSAAQTKNYINISEKQYIENGTFDEAANINDDSFGFDWHKHTDGMWNYSCNSGANAVLSYDEENRYLHVDASGWPSISYLIPGTLDAGAYTVSVDIYGEGAGTKGYSFDVFEISTGATVRIGENGAIMTRNAKAGEWVTVTFPFTLTSRGKVLFRFWGGSPFDYSIDNVTVTRPGVYADETEG